jgi:large subunit ribosomal protein L32
LGFWRLRRSSIGSNSRVCSSLPVSQHIGCPSTMQSPAWAEWNSRMELPEEADGFVGDMELMAVPKRKVTPSRRGKRNNGNWKLKSIPAIAKCKLCGRIKLPHLFCCDGQVQG